MTNDTKTANVSYVADLQNYAQQLVADAKDDTERENAKELASTVELVDLLVGTFLENDKALVRVGLRLALADAATAELLLMVLLGIVVKAERGRARAQEVVGGLDPEIRERFREAVRAKAQDAPK